jgi:NAD(P)-dependent dehydrogenase (short-subunit alcohol dehydrogenase family)
MAPYGIMSVEQEDDLRKSSLPVLNVNLVSTIYSIKLFLHHTQKHNLSPPIEGSLKARIAITGSKRGFYALTPDPIYAASKHGA